MQFQVRWFDAAAAVVREETLEAESRAMLESQMASAGRVVLAVQAAASQAQSRPWLAKTETLDVAWWCRELRTLLVAGMTVVEALDTLQAQSVGHVRTQVHAALVDQLRQGQALSAAMQAVGGFPSVLLAGVRASERTGGLVEALDDYLRYHEMLAQLRQKVVSAAIYPGVVVSLGGAITLFLLLFVMPRFAAMYSDLQGPTSGTTRLLIALSQTLNAHGRWVMAGLVVLGLAIVYAWRAGHVARMGSALVQQIEPLQRQIDEFRLAKFYHSLTLMFRGGYPLNDALSQCTDLGLGARLRDAVAAARQALARGQAVSSAFGDAGLTDPVTRRLLAVGERTGNFDRVLQTIAERHAGRFTTFIERATRVVEPVLLLLVALVVGGIVVMMYMPVFDIASSLR